MAAARRPGARRLGRHGRGPRRRRRRRRRRRAGGRRRRRSSRSTPAGPAQGEAAQALVGDAARPRRPVRDAGHRRRRRARRPQGVDRGPPAVGAGHRRPGHDGAAVPDDRVGGRGRQGGGDERAVARGDVRRARVGVPGGPPVGPARLRRRRRARRHDAARRVPVRLRAVDGLRGVPAGPHQGGVGRDRRQRRGHRHRPRPHGPHHHVGRGAADHRVRRVRRRRAGAHQAARRRAWPSPSSST